MLYSIEAEESYVGSVLIDPGVLSLYPVDPASFYSAELRHIVEKAIELKEKGLEVDFVSLSSVLDEKATSTMAACMARVPSPIHAETYARIIKNKAKFRRLLNGAQKVAQMAAEENEKAFSEVAKLFKTDEAELRYVSDLLDVGVERKNIYPTYTPLDSATLGLENGRLYLLAGRPFHGKTLFALNVALNTVLRNPNLNALIFSMEQPASELLTLLLAMSTEYENPMTPARIKAATMGSSLKEKYENNPNITDKVKRSLFAPLTRSEEKALEEAKEKLRSIGKRIAIDDTTGITPMGIRSRISAAAARAPLLVVVDYIQLVNAPGKNSNEKITAITRALKLASMQDMPHGGVILACSQLNREIERRPKKERNPKLSDLRDGGTLEQDADVIVFVVRPSMWDGDPAPRLDTMELHVRKNRVTGWLGTINAMLDRVNMRVYTTR